MLEAKGRVVIVTIYLSYFLCRDIKIGTKFIKQEKRNL